MPVTVDEKFGRRLSDDSAEVLYLIRGTTDDVVAHTQLLATAPATHDGLVLDDAEVEEIEGLDMYLGSVRYVAEEFTEPQTGSGSFSFDTAGGTQHISQSLATVARHAAAGYTAPDYQGAIGVTDDSVEGVDITVPVFSFTVTRYIAAASMTSIYISNLYALTGKVNAGSFSVDVDGVMLTFAAGECLFMGASGGKRREEDDWEITFRFAGSPNRSGFSVGSIAITSKKGWEYLWVRYDDAEDTVAKAVVKRPIAAYIEQVYELGNFNLLGV